MKRLNGKIDRSFAVCAQSGGRGGDRTSQKLKRRASNHLASAFTDRTGRTRLQLSTYTLAHWLHRHYRGRIDSSKLRHQYFQSIASIESFSAVMVQVSVNVRLGLEC
jgi:hypothetical protein